MMLKLENEKERLRALMEKEELDLHEIASLERSREVLAGICATEYNCDLCEHCRKSSYSHMYNNLQSFYCNKHMIQMTREIVSEIDDIVVINQNEVYIVEDYPDVDCIDVEELIARLGESESWVDGQTVQHLKEILYNR